MRFFVVLALFLTLSSCIVTRPIKSIDITDRTQWMESHPDNPIINVIQHQYANDDIEIVIKKKLTTDYVKIMLRNDRRIIKKETVANDG